jgi:DNA-binding transcriptional MerR regulator
VAAKTLTVGGLARAASVSEETVRTYADQGLIPHTRDSSGRRIFRASAVDAVRACYARRLLMRGKTTARGR